MKIAKAIEVLAQQVRYYHQIHQLDIIDALKEGIKALEEKLQREERKKK